MEDSIITGAYDLHVHSAPDILPRKMDDIEMAQRIIASGMAGYAIKSHFFCTAERAKLIRKLYPACDAIGTLCLNHATGGMNPLAVDIAARGGTKLIWFPTLDTVASQKGTFDLPPEKRPYWASVVADMLKSGLKVSPVDITKDGKVLPEVYEVLDVIAAHNMILATGHLSVPDTCALVKAAHERKVERIIVTHVSWPVAFFDISVQKELLRYGAYMEHCTNTQTSGKVSFETVLDQIRAIGPDHVVLSTDLGQSKNAYPDEGLLAFCERLVESGLSETEVRKMIVKNPVELLK